MFGGWGESAPLDRVDGNLHSMSSQSSPTDGGRPLGSPRWESLDGLRGIIIVLVVLGHLSAFLWPADGIRSTPYLRGLVGGGAVAAFYVVSGFIVTRGLLRDRELNRFDPGTFLARRVVRVGTQVAVLCAALLLVRGIDPTDDSPWSSTISSVTHSLTYSINWQLLLHPLETRPDVGHLWFVAIQQQWYLVLPLFLLVLGRRRGLGAGLLVAGAAACAAYRLATVSESTWFALSIDTFARADPLLLGMALALAFPMLLERLGSAGAAKAGWVNRVGWVALAMVFVLLAVNRELGPLAFLGPWSIAFNLTALALVAALVLCPPGASISTVLSWPPLTWLGRASLVIYVWHYPVIFWVGRHSTASSTTQTLLAVAILAVITAVSNRVVEEPIREWLSTHLRSREPVAPVTGQEARP